MNIWLDEAAEIPVGWLNQVSHQLRPNLQLHRFDDFYRDQHIVRGDLHFGDANRDSVMHWNHAVNRTRNEEDAAQRLAVEVHRINAAATEHTARVQEAIKRVMHDHLASVVAPPIIYNPITGPEPYTNTEPHPGIASVDILRDALRMLEQHHALPPAHPPTGAYEIQQRMEERRRRLDAAFAVPLRMLADEALRGAMRVFDQGMIDGAMIRPGDFMFVGMDEGHELQHQKALAKPETAETYTALAGLPAAIEDGHFKASLIDNSLRHYEESEKMGHCLWRIYNQRLRSRSHIAYHLDTPWNKNGLTLVMERARGIGRAGAEAEAARWVVHQLVGKGNSEPKERDKVQKFVDKILAQINATALADIKPEPEKQSSAGGRYVVTAVGGA